jgi:hypothetical protein
MPQARAAPGRVPLPLAADDGRRLSDRPAALRELDIVT